MNDDYLWNRSGEPDPEVERLERLLGPLRHSGTAPELPGRVAEFPRRSWLAAIPAIPWRAAVAALVLIAAGFWIETQDPHGGWEVTRLEGRPRVAGRSAEGRRLGVGEWLETDASSRAALDVGTIGQLEIEPNTRVRLLKNRLTEHRVALEQGKIQARIWAPPRLFFVDTPSAVAADLGCMFTLEVDPSGASLLRTSMGWVGFEWKGRESFVPAGAACATRPGVGPGTPYYEDASETFRAALSELDFDLTGAAALGAVLAETRPRDALTLWHLLTRLQGEDRARVYDRLATLLPAPSGATREGVLRGDRRMLDLWWDALGLGEASWWRLWKGPYPAR